MKFCVSLLWKNMDSGYFRPECTVFREHMGETAFRRLCVASSQNKSMFHTISCFLSGTTRPGFRTNEAASNEALLKS
jgi:hypothetical protein